MRQGHHVDHLLNTHLCHTNCKGDKPLDRTTGQDYRTIGKISMMVSQG